MWPRLVMWRRTATIRNDARLSRQGAVDRAAMSAVSERRAGIAPVNELLLPAVSMAIGSSIWLSTSLFTLAARWERSDVPSPLERPRRTMSSDRADRPDGIYRGGRTRPGLRHVDARFYQSDNGGHDPG